MANHSHVWVSGASDYMGTDERGKTLHLKDIPAEICSKCEEIQFSLDTLQLYEQRNIADEHNIKPKQITPLLLFYAPYPELGYWGKVSHRYKMDCNERMHKMLFYLWKRLTNSSYERVYIMDEFVPARSGPVSAHLKEMCRDLRNKELITYKESESVTDPFEGELTEKGEIVAKDMWTRTSEDIKEMILEVKKEFLFMDIDKLIEKVHREHPDYIKEY